MARGKRVGEERYAMQGPAEEPRPVFNLKGYQSDFVLSDKRFPAIISAWGTGKDLCAIVRAIMLSQESPDNLGLILRKEFRDLQDSTIRDFESYTGLKVDSNGDCLIPCPGGRFSRIMFRHIEALNSIQNLNLGWFWINQAEELPDDVAFQLLKGRLRRQTAKRRTGFLTANAGGHNWCWRTWLERKGENPEYPVWEATTYDNADVLPEDYIKSLKDLPERLFRRFVMNDHSIAEGLVWPEYKDELHSCESFHIPAEWKETLALDHGHDHPTAVVFGATNFDGKLIIYNEHFEAGQLISYHAERIKALEPLYRKMQRFIDPTCRFRNMQDGDRAYSVLEAYQDHGIYFRPAPMDADAGINKVGELFKANKILIFRDKCPNLIREIKEWKWKPLRTGHEKAVHEEPVRINEDACKALTYLVAGRSMPQETPMPKSTDRARPLAYELIADGPKLRGFRGWMNN